MKRTPYTRRSNPVHHVVVEGRLIDLTERQRQILALLGRGLTAAQVGAKLHIGRQDVFNRVNRMIERTGAARESLIELGARLADERQRKPA
jgi:DNA-binding CsgD family transcriptional regulator